MKVKTIYIKRKLKEYAQVSFEQFKAGKITRDELVNRYELIKKEGVTDGRRTV